MQNYNLNFIILQLITHKIIYSKIINHKNLTTEIKKI